MAKTLPAISDAEWEVMNILWQSAEPMMASDIVGKLADTKTWSPRTIKTLLSRLIKNALSLSSSTARRISTALRSVKINAFARPRNRSCPECLPDQLARC